MSGVLHRKLPLARADVAFDDTPTTTVPPRTRRVPPEPAVDTSDRDNLADHVDVDIDEDGDTKIIPWVRERHPRIQH